jgi:hypothetical protein
MWTFVRRPGGQWLLSAIQQNLTPTKRKGAFAKSAAARKQKQPEHVNFYCILGERPHYATLDSLVRPRIGFLPGAGF